MAKMLVNFRLSAELMAAIDIAAALEGRSRTDMVEQALSSWLMTSYPGIWAEAFPDLAAKRQKYITDYKDQQ